MSFQTLPQPFEAQVGKASAAERLAALTGDTINPHLSTQAIIPIEKVLAEAGPLTNVAIERRPEGDLGGGEELVVGPSAARKFPAPTLLNHRPASIPNIAAGTYFDIRPLEARMLSLSDGILAMIAEAPSVFAPDGSLLRSYSSTYSGLTYLYDVDIASLVREALRIDAPVIVLTDDVWGLNYCHWIADWLGRLAFAPKVDNLHVIVPSITTTWQVETLAACGISRERIIELGRWQAIQAATLYVPDNLSHIAHPARQASAEVIAFLQRSMIGEAPLDLGRRDRIYISRGDAGGRRLLNEEAIVAFLRDRQFEVVVPTELSAREQARIMASASVVVGPHGAGLTNALYCRPSARLLEIFPPTYGTPAFWLLAAGAGVDYGCYVADQIQQGSRSQLDDLWIDIEKFAPAFDRWLANPRD